MRRTRTGVARLVVGAVLIASALAGGVVVAVAEEPRATKKYPPYPDVWGYEFPYPEPGNRRAQIQMFTAESGEIYVITALRTHLSRREDGTCCDSRSERELLEFFSGRRKVLSHEEYATFLAEHRARQIESWPLGQVTVLGRHGEVQAFYRSHSRCFVHDPVHIVTRDPSGTVLRDVHVLYVRDDTLTVAQNKYCESANGASSVAVTVEHLWPRIFGLEDGTFLLADVAGNVLIRYTLRFTTGFWNERLFVMETTTFRDLAARALRLNDDVQDVQDALLETLRPFRRKE